MNTSAASERTSEFFDRYAREFNDIYGNKNTPANRVINTIFRRSMKLRYQRTLRGAEPVAGKTVIDVGSGPGHYSVALAERGAKQVLGVDFAPNMIEIATRAAERAHVTERCEFKLIDFDHFPSDQVFDYAVVMGFMDYMADPRSIAAKILKITGEKAFFSFPAEGGILAWQRKLRYKARCDLYMYSEAQVRACFAGLPVTKLTVEPIARDYFVTAYVR